MVYVPLVTCRRIGLTDTEQAQATCCTIRLERLQVCPSITRSIRRIRIGMSSASLGVDAFILGPARLSD